MAIRVAIHHDTIYDYDKYIHISPQTIRLRPAVHCRTPIESYSIKITPEDHFLNWLQDPFGNYVARVVVPKQIKQFRVSVEVIARMEVINPFDFFVEDYAEKFPFTYTEQLRKELLPYLEVKETSTLLNDLVAESKQFLHANTNDFLVNINRLVNSKVEYTIRYEPGIQSCQKTLKLGSGSCRDSAWLLVMLLRNHGLAARFTSGYLIQLKSDQTALDGPSGPEEDFTDLHAWAEVYIPGAGWIGLDATSGLLTSEGHIPLSCTPDPVSAAPITGYTEPADVSFKYSNEVIRIHEDPRVTKPYSDAEWNNILSLGESIETDLKQHDVRMTMGGEPTFVSVDDMESPEWNNAADGPDKRERAYELIKNLKSRFCPNGLVHFGQGKWYPEEPVPRWNLTLYWRKDGLPICKNDEYQADVYRDYGYGKKEAEKFIDELAKYLSVNPNNVSPAYEDVIYYLWEESNLPVNVDPLNVPLDDSIERRTLMDKLSDQGLNEPSGFVLPLEWNYSTNRWLSCAWQFRRKHLFLKPGNSPIGLRLPLDALPHQTISQGHNKAERSPFEKLDHLKNYHAAAENRYGQPGDSIPEHLNNPTKYDYKEEEEEEFQKGPLLIKEEEKEEYEPAYSVYTVKKALSVEVREGKLFVFLPPVDYFEHYLDLIASVELAADRLNLKIIVEGYTPPSDSRLDKMMVTPDPGVVEVNVKPSQSWNELLDHYNNLFEAAKESRLGMEKFMLDGRHTGTGGGNHVTIGGITPSDSPLLRRPDLLRSLLAFWQNHPGLSYLFSSAFVGPTSQAPRVDEARQDMIYELELAFTQIENLQNPPYWLVDRVFRNLLTDLTGNTHRAEFCIDKLYRPDTSAGQLGILELRAFDMPPNDRLCLVQLLLVRALVSMFWQKPYKKKLVRWGTQLHDRFLLHHYVYEDLKEVCDQLKDFGYPFKFEWLEPFFEFRFPLMGKARVKETELQIRWAIEPWHVLGEEMSNTGTARFVDSSLERVEVKLVDFNPERYSVLCNGYKIPLKQTDRQGEYVTGIRYKAWAPPSALHPTLPVDVPLVFDLYDHWNNKAIGGCTYFVSHPGGRSYDTFPVNSFEAESRRGSRFWGFGHTQGNYVPPTYNFGTGNEKRSVREHEVPKKDEDTEETSRYDEISELEFEPKEIEPDMEFPNTMDLRKAKFL